MMIALTENGYDVSTRVTDRRIFEYTRLSGVDDSPNSIQKQAYKT
jgi:hypothetical protein